jgi:Fe2+ or Zn2+ uptake regulation protein
LRLTPAERAIVDTLRLHDQQATIKDLAGRLKKDEETIRHQLKDIYKKGKKAGIFSHFGGNMAELVRYYITHPEEHALAPAGPLT